LVKKNFTHFLLATNKKILIIYSTYNYVYHITNIAKPKELKKVGDSVLRAAKDSVIIETRMCYNLCKMTHGMGRFLKDFSGKIKVRRNPVVGIMPTSPAAKAKKTKFLGYDFAVPIFTNQSVSKLWFEVNEENGSAPIVYDNDGQGYIIPQGEVIYVPWLSTKHFTSDGTGLVSNGFTIVAGVSWFFLDPDA
jgi:hypothetical protein